MKKEADAMRKILIAVDDPKDSKAMLSTFYNLACLPEEVILLHVQRLQGKSLMIDMLGNAEMETLKKALKETEHQEKLDGESEKILNYYKSILQDSRFSVRTVIREGIPAEEILRVSEEEAVELIILGHCRRRGLARLISGSVTRDVEQNAKTPVFVARPDRKVYARFGPILFLSFWAAVGIYSSSVLIMDHIGKRLFATSESYSVLLFYYMLYLAGFTIVGIITAIVGGIFGRLIPYDRLK